jgi:hypothetical protein
MTASGGILQIRVHHDGGIAIRIGKSGADGGLMAEIAR